MNRFLSLGTVLVLAGAVSMADGATTGQHGIGPGGCMGPYLRAPGQRSDPSHLAITAKVHWSGNSYGRMPDGQIIGTLMGCDWESCYIVVDGRTVLLHGLPGDIVDQQGYRGQTLILVGQFEQFGSARRQARGAMTGARMNLGGVLLVDRFYRV
jgi:hypothetical protein